MKKRRCWSGSQYKGSEERRKRAEKLERFVRERDEMLLKCSVEELKHFVVNHAKEYGEDFVEAFLLAGDLIQEVTLHKMIAAVTTMPVHMRRDSMAWLTEHGYKAYGYI